MTASSTTHDNLQDRDPISESRGLRVPRLLHTVSNEFGWPALLIMAMAPEVSSPSEHYIYFQVSLGTMIALMGLLLRVWSKGFLREQGFVLDGPYRYVRNPVQCGACLVYIGCALLAGVAPWFLPALAGLTILWLTVSGQFFEKKLLLELGAPFLRYQQRVRRWMPSTLPGTNRSNRDWLLTAALVHEKKSLLWLMGYLVVVAVRFRT